MLFFELDNNVRLGKELFLLVHRHIFLQKDQNWIVKPHAHRVLALVHLRWYLDLLAIFNFFHEYVFGQLNLLKVKFDVLNTFQGFQIED
jgi:hypothetical protein